MSMRADTQGWTYTQGELILTLSISPLFEPMIRRDRVSLKCLFFLFFCSNSICHLSLDLNELNDVSCSTGVIVVIFVVVVVVFL